MYWFKSIFTALFLATAPITAIDNAPLGKQTVTEVRGQYQSGTYSDFLSSLDSSYKEADLTDLIAMRGGEISEEKYEQLEKEILALQNEKNQELLQLISDEDTSTFAEKVRSVASTITTPEQEKAIHRINSLISMQPGAGKNQDENTLINIDVEYEYKLLHAKTDNSLNGNAERLALRMEKMDKMVAASKKFEDTSLKNAVAIYAATLDQRLARNLDGADLNLIVKGQVKASNSTEQQAADLIASYQEQISDLMHSHK